MKKNVIAVAAAQTYEMVIRHGIHAHPAVAPYPKPRDYIIPIRKGGKCEYIYKVVKTVDIIPNQIESVLGELEKRQADCLMNYYNERSNSYGFSRIGTPYRFYILKKMGSIEQPYYLNGIQNCVSLCFDDIPVVNV